MNKVDISLFDNEKNIDTLKLYESAINNTRGVTCEEQEEKLFNRIPDKKRLLIELQTIKKTLENDTALYLKYNDYYQEVVAKCDVIALTESVIPEIKEMIVLLDMACGIKVHLYSVIPSLIGRLKEEDYNGTKRNRH